MKLFDKYGLSTTVTSFEGSAKGAAALQAGQIDIGGIDSGTALSSQLTDVPLVALSLAGTFLTDNLVCGPSIKGAADVKGKKIAVGTFGGPSHAAALLSLKALKLGATDAAITQIGGQATRIAAIKGGSTECGIVDKNLEADMVRDGLNIVASIWKPPTQAFGRSAVLVTKAFLAKNPNTALVVVAAVLEGQNLVWTDATGTAQRFAQHLQTTPDRTQPLVADFQIIGNRSLMWKDEAFLNAQKVLATVNPDIIDVKITDAFDRTLLEKLLQNGFYAKIGNPATTP